MKIGTGNYVVSGAFFMEQRKTNIWLNEEIVHYFRNGSSVGWMNDKIRKNGVILYASEK